MLTKNQASQIADGLIAQQRELLAEREDSQARGVSFVYRCPELAKLPKREQAALLRRAKSIVQGEWMFHLMMLVLFAVIPLTWWVSHGAFGASGPFTVILALAVGAVNVLLRSLIVRLVVRALADRHTHSG